MYVILLNYLVPEERIVPLRAAHYEFSDACFKKGLFLLGARRVPPTGGFILARGVPREELDQALADDPYLRAGVVSHDVIEVLPTRALPDLARALDLEL